MRKFTSFHDGVFDLRPVTRTAPNLRFLSVTDWNLSQYFCGAESEWELISMEPELEPQLQFSSSRSLGQAEAKLNNCTEVDPLC